MLIGGTTLPAVAAHVLPISISASITSGLPQWLSAVRLLNTNPKLGGSSLNISKEVAEGGPSLEEHAKLKKPLHRCQSQQERCAADNVHNRPAGQKMRPYDNDVLRITRSRCCQFRAHFQKKRLKQEAISRAKYLSRPQCKPFVPLLLAFSSLVEAGGITLTAMELSAAHR